jgi:hypothetical protein
MAQNPLLLQQAIATCDSRATVRVKMADGNVVISPRVTITLPTCVGQFTSDETYFVIPLDDRWDLILGMGWLEDQQPWIDWRSKTLHRLPKSLLRAFQRHVQSSLGVMSNELTPSSAPTSPSIAQSLLDLDSTTLAAPNDALVVRAIDSCDDPSMDIDETTRRNTLANVASTRRRVRVDSVFLSHCDLEELPQVGKDIVQLPEMSFEAFEDAMRSCEIASIAVIQAVQDVSLAISSTMDVDAIDDPTPPSEPSAYLKAWDALKTNPHYDLLREFAAVFPEEVPQTLPKDKGVRHEIDLLPGTKWCVTRQWPLPKEQVDHIDAFFAKREKAGHVRASTSPHSSPTFCVKKATGGWRIVHAYNKLNDATIPAQTPIPRKDVIIDSMAGSTTFSTIDLRDGFYQTLMRIADVPKTAVSTPSGMLWEWLVMPQGLSNAPATFNRLVTGKLRPLRSFAPSYFDDIYIHSRASPTESDTMVHRRHLREVLLVLQESGLYANLQKCMFGVTEIPVLGDFVGINGCRVDPSKVAAIRTWPTPRNVSELRSWLGLATYLHKFSENFASIARPLTSLLAKDTPWLWSPSCEEAFDGIKTSLMNAPVLALPDFARPFSVVCDASIRGIGCCLMQDDAQGIARPVSYQSRQLRKAERNYPVHDLELLAVKYALGKFQIYLRNSHPFVVYTDHASLKYAVKSTHISQRMERWNSYFAEFNMTLEYKPGRENVLADALSRRPYPDTPEDVDLNVVTTLHTDLFDRIRAAYACDPSMKAIIERLHNPDARGAAIPQLERYRLKDGLLLYNHAQLAAWRVAVPCDASLRNDIMFDFHDSPSGGHLGRDKTYVSIARSFWWPRIAKSVSRYTASCDACQHVKASPAVRAPLMSLAVPDEVWSSISMDFIFGLPRDSHGNTGIWTIIDRASKYMVALPVKDSITAEQAAHLFFDHIYCHFGLPKSIVSDRDPRFTAKFWTALFTHIGTKLDMSTSDHPESDGQSERANRIIEDILRAHAVSRKQTWSSMLPHVVFAYNTAEHSSTGFTPFYVNHLRHPTCPSILDSPIFSGEGTDLPRRTATSVEHFVQMRDSIILQVQDAIALAQAKQANNANKTSRGNTNLFEINDEVLVHRSVVPKASLGNAKLRQQWWGPFPITQVVSRASYRVALPAEWKIHDVFYIGKLKKYLPRLELPPAESPPQPLPPALDPGSPASPSTSTAQQRSSMSEDLLEDGANDPPNEQPGSDDLASQRGRVAPTHTHTGYESSTDHRSQLVERQVPLSTVEPPLPRRSLRFAAKARLTAIATAMEPASTHETGLANESAYENANASDLFPRTPEKTTATVSFDVRANAKVPLDATHILMGIDCESTWLEKHAGTTELAKDNLAHPQAPHNALGKPPATPPPNIAEKLSRVHDTRSARPNQRLAKHSARLRPTRVRSSRCHTNASTTR